MKKVVTESLSEFRKNRLNEGFIDNAKNIMSKVGQNIKGLLQKFGKFFWPVINGQVFQNVNAPVNIGTMVKDNLLKKTINYVASAEDIQLNPSLKSLNNQNLLNQYKLRDKEHDAEEKILVQKWVENIKRGEKIEDPRLRESYFKKIKKDIINETKLFEANLALEHPDQKSGIPNIGLEELIELIQNKIVNPASAALFIWGAPGIGKTQIVNSILNASGGRLIDLETSKMRNDDWTLPYIAKKMVAKNPTEEEKIASEYNQTKAYNAPKSWIPGYEPTGEPEIDKILNDEANGKNGGIIFFDEINRAYPDVLATCLKVIGERKVGDLKIGDKWGMVAAANRPGDDKLINKRDWTNILSNRFMPIVNYVPTFQEWKPWAYENKINENIMTFLEFNSEYFYYWDTEAEINATPRSWHYASGYIDDMKRTKESMGLKLEGASLLRAFQTALGTKLGTEFVTFMRLLNRYSLEDINTVLKTPKKAPIFDKVATPEINAFLAAVVKKTSGKTLTPEEFANYCTYLVLIDNSPMASKALQLLIKYHDYLNSGLGDAELFAEDKLAVDNKKYIKGINIFLDKYKKFF